MSRPTLVSNRNSLTPSPGIALVLAMLCGLVVGAPRIALGEDLIATVSGSGEPGFDGDDGLALQAKLNRPHDVAFGPDGSLFIVDNANHRVRRVDAATGVITTVAGTGTAGFSGDNGPATAAMLNGPWGLAIAGDGTLYISETGNHRIRRVAGGIITTVAGTGVGGFNGNGAGTVTQLDSPRGIALDAAGNLFIAEFFSERVRRLAASNGMVTTVAGTGVKGFSGDGGAATSARLNQPIDVAFDSAGNWYIADAFNRRVRKVNTSGTIQAFAGTGSGDFTGAGDGGPATSARLGIPWAVTVDDTGNVFIVDLTDQRIRRVAASDGIITSFVGSGIQAYGGDCGPALLANLSAPVGATFDDAGALFLADSGNNRIRRIAEDIPDGICECGNSILEGDEECDDGGTAPGDGCDGQCLVDDSCVVRDLESTPNPSAAFVEDGGSLSLYYRVECPTGVSVSSIPVVFRSTTGVPFLGSTDDEGVFRLDIASQDIGVIGSLLQADLEAINGLPPGAPFTINGEVAPRRLTRGYQIGVGAGGGLGPKVKVTIGKSMSAGLTIDERADELSSLSGGPVSFSRRFAMDLGVSVSKPGVTAGRVSTGRASLSGSIGPFLKDGFRFQNLWTDGGEQLLLAGLALETVVLNSTPDLVTNQVLDWIIDRITPLGDYRTSEGFGAAAAIDGKVSLVELGFPDAALPLNIKAEAGVHFGLSVLAEMLLSNPDEFAVQLDLDAELDIGLAANTFTQDNPEADQVIHETFGYTGGKGGGLAVKAVFTGDAADLKRIEVEISQVDEQELEGSFAQAALALSGSKKDTEQIAFVFEEDAAHEIVDQLDDIFLSSIIGGGVPVLGPTLVIQDLTELFDLARGLDYEFERTRSLANKKETGTEIDLLVVKLNLSASYTRTLQHVVQRGSGRGRLFITESYDEEEFDEADLPPGLADLASTAFGHVLDEARDAIFGFVEDRCDDIGLLIAPAPCIFVSWDPLGIFVQSRAAGVDPRLGIGGYHLLRPEGLIIVPAGSGAFVSADGRARLDVADGRATLTLSYAPAEVDTAWEQDLRIHRWLPEESRWLLVGGVLDAATRTVAVPIERFGLYTLGPVLPTGEIVWKAPASVAPGSVTKLTAKVLQTDERTADGKLVTVEALDAFQATPTAVGTLLTADADGATPGLQVATKKGNLAIEYQAPTDVTRIAIRARSVLGDAGGEAHLVVSDVKLDPSAPPPAGTEFVLQKGTIVVPRSGAGAGKFTIVGRLRYPLGQAPRCQEGDFRLTLRDGDMGVFDESATLVEVRAGSKWTYKAPKGTVGIAGVTLMRRGDSYGLKVNGTGDLSGIIGAELTFEAGCAGDASAARASFQPKLSAKTLKLKFSR